MNYRDGDEHDFKTHDWVILIAILAAITIAAAPMFDVIHVPVITHLMGGGA